MLKNIALFLTLLIPTLALAEVEPLSTPSPNVGTITPTAIVAETGSFSGSVTVGSMTAHGGVAVGNTALGVVGGVVISPGPTGGLGYIQWIRNGGVRSAYMGYSNNNPDLTLENGSTFGILGGSVGIGTASPCSTCTLHVAGGASVTGAFAVASATFTVATTGIVSAPSQPFVRAIDHGQSTNAGWNTLFFNAPAADNNRGGMFGGAASSDTFTTNGAGLYEACILVLPAATTSPALRFTVGGSAANDRSKYFATVAGNISVSYCEKMVLASGAVVRAEFYGAGASSTSAGYGSFSMVKIW